MVMSDIINKTFHNCGCIHISKLDFLENQINDTYIQLCSKHFNSKIHQLKNYKWNKKYNKYILKDSVPNKNTHNSTHTNNKLKKQKSFENLKKLNDRLDSDNLNDPIGLTILNFGKYKNYSYEYVYYNDKLYCYNLAFWNNKIHKNKAITDFINYINDHINLK